MKFKNIGEDKQIRIGEGFNKYRWVSVRKGETIDIPEHIGLANRLKVDVPNVTKPPITEGKIRDLRVETKQIDVTQYTPDDSFLKELISIRGIGKSTAEDVVSWGTKEKLIEELKKNINLPFRNDIDKKLRKKYG